MADFRTAERRAQRIKFYSHSIWPKIRKFQLAKEPLCRLCADQGRMTVATVCDHIDPDWEGWNGFIKGPFQSLCRQCHDDKTACVDVPKMIKKNKLKLEFF